MDDNVKSSGGQTPDADTGVPVLKKTSAPVNPAKIDYEKERQRQTRIKHRIVSGYDKRTGNPELKSIVRPRSLEEAQEFFLEAYSQGMVGTILETTNGKTAFYLEDLLMYIFSLFRAAKKEEEAEVDATPGNAD